VGESIRLLAVLSRAVRDREVELREVFRLACLAVAQLLCRSKVLQVLVVT
jgi:hypothetical protein